MTVSLASLGSRLLGPASPDRRRLSEAVSGRVVLVTGSSAGIGRRLALELGQAGAEVLLVARSEEGLRSTAEEIAARGGAAVAYPADLSDVNDVARLAEEVAIEHGAVDVLVNNAGLSIRRSLALSHDRLHFQRTINVNYVGPVALALALLPAMRTRRSGHLVNVSTVGVKIPTPRYGAYLASKAAFDVWLRCAAPELRLDGVAVSSVYLPLVRTRMSAPTRLYSYMPALDAGQAAALVARAIVERRRTVAPAWARLAELIADAAQGPFEAAMSVAFRLTTDSDAAAGGAEGVEVSAVRAARRRGPS
jgi:short-subunit dehydrogenase